MANQVIITVTNQKGGVGKTTTVVNLSHALARMGKSVLIIDTDPQGQASQYLGLEAQNDLRIFLEDDPVARSRDLSRMITPTGRKNLDIIRSNSYSADTQLITAKHDATFVRKTISTTRQLEHYQFIVFDTSPSIGGLQEKAIFAANQIIAPTLMTNSSLSKLSDLFKDISNLRKYFGWEGELFGVLPCAYERVTRESLDAYEATKKAFPEDALLDPISKSVRFNEAHRLGRTIFEHDPKSKGAEEYEKLAKEIIRFT